MPQVIGNLIITAALGAGVAGLLPAVSAAAIGWAVIGVGVSPTVGFNSAELRSGGRS